MRIIFIVVFVLLGCANNQALDLIQTTTEKLKPVVDAHRYNCPLVVETLEKEIEIISTLKETIVKQSNVLNVDHNDIIYKIDERVDALEDLAKDSRDWCNDAWTAFKKIQAIQEMLIVLFGGEPCSENGCGD